MRPPRWGHLYDFDLPGALAEAVVVASEDEWNTRTRDAVVVPVYRNPGAVSSNVRVAVNDDLFADTTRVQNVEQTSIGEHRGILGEETMIRIRLGVRIYLDIERLQRQAGPREVPRTRSSWWPDQGLVRYAELAQFPEDKMFGILSDDDWNSRETTLYSGAVRLTSRAGPSGRSAWVVEVTGGYTVAGHLYSLLHEDIDRRAPRSPRPHRLIKGELAEIADRLSTLLVLR